MPIIQPIKTNIKSIQNFKISKMNLRVRIPDLRIIRSMKCANTLHPMGSFRLQTALHISDGPLDQDQHPLRWRQELTIGICIDRIHTFCEKR